MPGQDDVAATSGVRPEVVEIEPWSARGPSPHGTTLAWERPSPTPDHRAFAGAPPPGVPAAGRGLRATSHVDAAVERRQLASGPPA